MQRSNSYTAHLSDNLNLISMNAIVSNIDHAKSILEQALSYLGVDGVTVTVAVNTRMLDKFAEEGCELTALTVPSFIDKTYNLYLRRVGINDVVLCHEAVHISQYADGRLAMDKQGRVSWNGIPYDKTTPYYARPWEVEAYDREKEVLNKIDR